jgi:hypothetical protein
MYKCSSTPRPHAGAGPRYAPNQKLRTADLLRKIPVENCAQQMDTAPTRPDTEHPKPDTCVSTICKTLRLLHHPTRNRPTNCRAFRSAAGAKRKGFAPPSEIFSASANRNTLPRNRFKHATQKPRMQNSKIPERHALCARSLTTRRAKPNHRIAIVRIPITLVPISKDQCSNASYPQSPAPRPQPLNPFPFVVYNR